MVEELAGSPTRLLRGEKYSWNGSDHGYGVLRDCDASSPYRDVADQQCF
jgi:hypothetical protein